MPKMKTHKGSAKRYSVSGSGKLRHRKANGKHLIVGKRNRWKHETEGSSDVSDADYKRVSLSLPYKKYLR